MESAGSVIAAAGGTDLATAPAYTRYRAGPWAVVNR